MTDSINSLLQDSPLTLQHISEDFDGTVLKQDLHDESSGAPLRLCIKPNLNVTKEETLQEFHASDLQGAPVPARSTTSSILEDLLDIQNSTRAVHKVDEKTHSSFHLVQKSSNASLLRSIINNDHSGAKKDFAKFFQKSRVSPAQSRRLIFQDGRAQESRRSKELKRIESDKGKREEDVNSKGEIKNGEIKQAEISIEESVNKEVYKDESSNEESYNGEIDNDEGNKVESDEFENYRNESIKDEFYQDDSSDKGESDDDESIEGANDENISFNITAESAVTVDSITDNACVPASILMDSSIMASAQNPMDMLEDCIDLEFWEDNVLVEKLNENVYEKEFYDNEHTIYVGRDKMLGPLCIAIKEDSLTEDCDAIVRGQLLSAHIKLRQEDFADIFAEGVAEDSKSGQNIKNVSLLATLKAYTAFLEKNYPNIHGLIGQHKKQDEDIDSAEKVDDKGLALGSIQRLRKLAESSLSCFRSKQHQNNVDGICEAFRRLDLATVRRAHFIDVPVNEGEHEKVLSILANLLDVNRDGTSYSNELVHDTQANFTKQIDKIDPEKRSWVIQELIESEEKYLKSLRQLEEISRSIQQEILETKTLQPLRFEINVIFGNITEIYQRHASLADCIKRRASEIEMCLGQILKENFENFSKPYYLYLSNRSKAIETHQKLMSKSNKYKKLIMNLEELYGTATEKISISSLLIEPVQRIPRYTLLIDEILKVTTADHEDREHLHSAKDVANQIASVHEGQEEITARVINNLITSVKSCPPTLLKTNRRLITHIDADEIDVLNGKVLRYVTLILFNDILVVVKRVSQSASGKTILPSEQAGGGHDDLSAKYSHSNTILPDMVATRNLSSHGNRADFKFKSSIPLTSVEISVPKGNTQDPESLDDIIYIRTSDNAIDDQEYFSSGSLRQYVLGSSSHGGHAFVRLVNEHRASSSISGEAIATLADQAFILKKHVGASDVFFCIRPQQGYNLRTTKNSMALCFENPNDANPPLVPNPTMLSDDGGLLIVQKHDNDTYRSTLSASLQVSNLIVSARENETKHQLTELLNGGRDSQRYRRARFQPLMMKQLMFMDAALQSYKRRKMFDQGNRDLLEQLIKRFDSKLQRTIPTSLLWNQSRSTHAVTAPPQYPQLQRRPSTFLDPTPPPGVELESAVTMVSNDQIRRTQPLVTQLTHVWEVVPIYDRTPPSPYQKRQSVKPSFPRQDKIGGADDNINTDWNKIRVSNESNISLASQISSMSSMSIRSRISTRNYMSINLKGSRSRYGFER